MVRPYFQRSLAKEARLPDHSFCTLKTAAESGVSFAARLGEGDSVFTFPLSRGETVSDHRTALLDLLRARSFKRGHFKLASGEASEYYIDGKLTSVSSEGARLIGEILYEHTKDLDIAAIGGLEMGAVPLTTAAVMTYSHHGREMEGFWVRTKPKDHGTQRSIEGNLKPGSRVVIVDDVVTTGTSVIKAVDEVRKLNCEIVLLVALVDRLRGAGELFQSQGFPYKAVFSIEDFGVIVNERQPAATTFS
jgi:orotate phosphoribosyltransferase